MRNIYDLRTESEIKEHFPQTYGMARALLDGNRVHPLIKLQYLGYAVCTIMADRAKQKADEPEAE